ncbi:sugar phosphate isomerase/epimerase family protein [Coraliomargarita algicola]|uniref:Sugar phosphate isomerase/epimerase family protein n=1 Tax=Coraliomargarita algicola TaxID=3092156 RepID=A0ABZ0RIZ4_9BACT|nr:sugar phosphate isomerase/epimerase family protein [Coraliomargarita sp. J2-16]WPJ96176.1 sugar phosphate isomerase/epimerase family protein [Coraliomargarita sp. J2-16]
MKIEQVALITYTIRDFIQTPDDFRQSMQKIAEIGYQAVQISGMPHDVMPATEIAAVCAENGLTICATHEPSLMILNEPEKVVERLQQLGTKYTAYPFPSDVDFSNAQSREKLIQQLDHAGSVLREAGLVLTYHNHANEFYKWDGKPALQHLIEQTSPENLLFEPDTYWVQLGGYNPVDWCKLLQGRMPLLHLKDVGVRKGNEPIMHEIGYGNLDFKSIIAAAEESGCEWYIVEQDTCPGDPFDSLKLSFDYIKANLVS